MDQTISRRDFVGLLGLSAALTLAPSGWAAAVSREEAEKGLLIRPYLQPGPRAGDGPDCKDIVWMTDAREETFSVEYGWAGAPPRSAVVQRAEIKLKAPTPEQLKKKPATPPTTGEAHEDVKASQLESQAQYYLKFWATLDEMPRGIEAWYRVRRNGEIVSENRFRTRASADQAVSFVAVGDMASGKAGQAAVAYQASLLKPDFFLALGDLCYAEGRVSQYHHHFWGTYANVETPAVATGAPLMETTPFYALLGNHDADTSLNVYPDCLGIYYFFHAPENGPGEGKWMTPIGRDKDAVAHFRAATKRSYPTLGFYSFDEGPAHFAVVDSNGYCPIDNAALIAWLERDLNASKAPWKFVCMHAPMFHSSPQHFVEQKMRLLGPVLTRCAVDVVLSAHVHNYQRSRPMHFAPAPRKAGDRLVHGAFRIDTEFDGVSNTRPNGTIHIVSGGGGGSLIKDDLKKVEGVLREKYGDNWAPYTVSHIVDRHSLVTCQATKERLALRAIDQAGAEIDRIVITKPNA
jgi:hypothetical protein